MGAAEPSMWEQGKAFAGRLISRGLRLVAGGLGVLAIFLLVPGLAQAVGAESTDELLALLRVLLSWPAVVLALGLTLLVRFHEPIATRIREGDFSLPGGFNFGGRQQQPLAVGGDAGIGPGAATPEASRSAPGPEFADLVGVIREESARSGAMKERLDYEFRRGLLWEFQALNLFLIEPTKAALFFCRDSGGVPRPTLLSFLAQQFPQVQQHGPSVDVLIATNLLGFEGARLVISTKGAAFLRHLELGAPWPSPYPGGRILNFPLARAAWAAGAAEAVALAEPAAPTAAAVRSSEAAAESTLKEKAIEREKL